MAAKIIPKKPKMLDMSKILLVEFASTAIIAPTMITEEQLIQVKN